MQDLSCQKWDCNYRRVASFPFIAAQCFIVALKPKMAIKHQWSFAVRPPSRPRGGHYDDTVNWVQFWFTFSSNFSSSSVVAKLPSSKIYLLDFNAEFPRGCCYCYYCNWTLKSVLMLVRSLSHRESRNPDFVSVSNVSFPLLLPSNGNLD